MQTKLYKYSVRAVSDSQFPVSTMVDIADGALRRQLSAAALNCMYTMLTVQSDCSVTVLADLSSWHCRTDTAL